MQSLCQRAKLQRAGEFAVNRYLASDVFQLHIAPPALQVDGAFHVGRVHHAAARRLYTNVFADVVQSYIASAVGHADRPLHIFDIQIATASGLNIETFWHHDVEVRWRYSACPNESARRRACTSEVALPFQVGTVVSISARSASLWLKALNGLVARHLDVAVIAAGERSRLPSTLSRTTRGDATSVAVCADAVVEMSSPENADTARCIFRRPI